MHDAVGDRDLVRALVERHERAALDLLAVALGRPERTAVDRHLDGAAVGAKPELVVPVRRGQQRPAPRRRPFPVESDLGAERHRRDRGVQALAVDFLVRGANAEEALRGTVHGAELGRERPPPVLRGRVAPPLEEGRAPGRFDRAFENDAVVAGRQGDRRLGEGLARVRAQDLAAVDAHAPGRAE